MPKHHILELLFSRVVSNNHYQAKKSQNGKNAERALLTIPPVQTTHIVRKTRFLEHLIIEMTKNKSWNSVLPFVAATVVRNVGASNAGRDYGSQSSWEALHHVTHPLEGWSPRTRVLLKKTKIENRKSNIDR